MPGTRRSPALLGAGPAPPGTALGCVSAADPTTGRIVRMHGNGTARDVSPLPLPFRTGVLSLGGPRTTAGGVAFLSDTIDYSVIADALPGGYHRPRGPWPTSRRMQLSSAFVVDKR